MMRVISGREDKPVSLGSHKLSDRVRERGVRADVKHGIRVFAVVHAAGGEDD